jgi:hypothetical protein
MQKINTLKLILGVFVTINFLIKWGDINEYLYVYIHRKQKQKE